MTKEEAIEIIRSCNLDDDAMEVLTAAIPELKESEDERIRKWIIKELESKYVVDDIVNNKFVCKAFAWLEKQGEQKQHLELKAGHWYFCHQAYCERADVLTVREGETFKCEKDGIVKGLIIKEPEKYFREISTPVDKVEPKFKVGDWVANKHGIPWLIDSFDKMNYQAYSVDGEYCYFPISKQNEMHLWTIEDAKEGDVLTWDDSKCIALFKEVHDEDSFKSYGCAGACTGVFEKDAFHDIENAHPATKEQRDFLFSEMKEAGYEWNAERKELRKIISDSAWSEEDEKKLFDIKCLIGNYRTGYEHDLCSWIDNLKNRLQAQPKQDLDDVTVNDYKNLGLPSDKLWERNV